MAKKENDLLGLEKIFEKNGINIKTLAQVLENSEIINIVEIPVSFLTPNRFQPRMKFDDEKLKELADSIKKHGVITPIIVREIGQDQYEIVAGERRTRASLLAKKETIPAIVADFNDQQMMELSLIENIQRENLNGIEEARSYQTMKEHLGYTQAQIAKEVGKPRSHVANLLRLLTLPEVIQNYILNEKISIGHAKVLVGLNDTQAVQLANRIIYENLSVRDVEKILLSYKPRVVTHQSKNQAQYQELEKEMMQKMHHSKIQISEKKIQINFSSYAELEQFVKQFTNES